MPTTLQWRLADKVFFSRVRAALGGRVEFFVSGGAPLSREVLDWYASIGILIYEGYGLTEASPIIAVNNVKSCRAGSVGPVIRNVEIQVAADGEILVKGSSIFKGYWNMPEETANAFEGEWFRTGDVGYLDAEGFLYITDRKKDLIKTSGGKFISPQPIECKLKASLLVDEAAIMADRRKFPSAIIVPNFPALEDWARVNRVPFASREELVATAEVLALYESIMACVNKDLAQFEKIKKFIILPDEFSMATGALTPTMKLKRRVIEQRYSKELDQLYNSETEALRVG
jgi:long-chain acyl-CoA synthetase